MNPNLTGELIYSYDLDITSTTDYGVSMTDILGSKVKIPAQGARFDVAFAGRAMGRLAGAVRGVDYLRMRADGRIDLDIRATIETADGCRIALSADGVALPQPGNPVVELRENVSLTTAAEKFAWVNARQIWAAGTVNLATGKIHIDGFLQ
jgi:predicted RNA-binding protein